MLVIDDIEVVYDRIVLALRGVSLTVPAGAVVALLGANGAGKSTTLKAASGLLSAERGQITRGQISLRGQSTGSLPARALVGRGLVQVLEGRHCFPHLTVEENLIAGALVHRPSRRALAADLQRVYGYFPRIEQRRQARAGFLSGGEQQMVALGRALMSRAQLILLDEPSMGLAPQVVQEIFEILRRLNQHEGVSLLLAEQNATLALKYADHGYVLENGRVVAEGRAQALSERPDVKNFYLGVGESGRRQFRRRELPPMGTI